MIRKLAAICLSAVFLASLVAGCCCGGGREKTTVVTEPAPAAPAAPTVPVGEQLIKLKEAYDQGAMTKEEYEKAKEKVLKEQ